MREKLEELGILLKRSSGYVKTKCPKCSHTRKNKSDNCLSVDIDQGVYNCHHCGWSGNVRFEKKKEYIKPPKIAAEVNERVVEWFASRGISEPTVSHWKIGESLEYMPQVQKKRRCINFNYYRDNELINVKYRDAEKNFKLVSQSRSEYDPASCSDKASISPSTI